jgi:antitoxin component HigA of HigAB toxin-antitoxin module
MADNASLDGPVDRDRVSLAEDYEIADFAEQWDLPVETVVALIDEHGNKRADLERVVKERGKDARG